MAVASEGTGRAGLVFGDRMDTDVPAIEMPEEKWDRVIRTNLSGTFNVA
jgi:NAD(P)-dependent dehydrogenase (short-subunit alcohol dehydrogenase family)